MWTVQTEMTCDAVKSKICKKKVCWKDDECTPKQ